MMESADIETLPQASPPAPARGSPPVAHRHEIASMSDQPAAPSPDASPRPAQRRFRASDVAEHLDMGVIGDICVGVTLAGYRSVLGGFLADEGGSLHALLAALAAADGPALAARAHAVKGAAASMGLRAVQVQAALLESTGDSLSPLQCQAAAARLQERVDTVRALLQRMGFL
jgi:HPt (histidine-containing phosphotransfer) domain-containing protein